MVKTFYLCKKCWRYTFNSEKCPVCNGKVSRPYPPRFSLEKEFKYAKYRILARKEMEKENKN